MIQDPGGRKRFGIKAFFFIIGGLAALSLVSFEILSFLLWRDKQEAERIDPSPPISSPPPTDASDSTLTTTQSSTPSEGTDESTPSEGTDESTPLYKHADSPPDLPTPSAAAILRLAWLPLLSILLLWSHLQIWVDSTLTLIRSILYMPHQLFPDWTDTLQCG